MSLHPHRPPDPAAGTGDAPTLAPPLRDTSVAAAAISGAATRASARTHAAGGAWAPLADPLFRSLWIASLASNIGTWLQNVAAGWEMTHLTQSPLLIAMVQVVTTAPAFVLAMFAGALSDIVDRRVVLIGTQVAGCVVALMLAVVTAIGALSAAVLLLLTFLMGVQAALMTPAWAANTADVVPRTQLPAAVALGSLSFNLSRAVGPALGGLLVSALNPAVAFALNAVSFMFVLVVLLRWKRPQQQPALAPEGLWAAMKSSLRFMREEPAFRALLVRCAGFTMPAAAVFALLPVVARDSTFASAYGYAALLSAIGAGAVVAALLMPRLRAHHSRDALVNVAAVGFAAALAVTAATDQFAFIVLALPVAGAAWLGTLSNLQIAAQTLAPGWVRARALALYFMTLNGAIALGGFVWGTVASSISTRVALGAAAATLLVGVLALRRYRIVHIDANEPGGAGDQPSPHVVDRVPDDAGPVLVTIAYSVPASMRPEFAREMRELGRLRRRDGAFSWECSFDIRDETQALETFRIESWVEHLRQHARIGPQTRAVQRRLRALCIGEPQARHYVSISAGLPVLQAHPPVGEE